MSNKRDYTITIMLVLGILTGCYGRTLKVPATKKVRMFSCELSLRRGASFVAKKVNTTIMRHLICCMVPLSQVSISHEEEGVL